MKMLQKPEKVLFDNTNIMYALSSEANQGTLRETYFAEMMSFGHTISMPQKGDLLVDKHILFEVGGRSKGYKQIANFPTAMLLRMGLTSALKTKSRFGCSE